MSKKENRNITLKDVANHAGVSRTTVSVALSGSSYISEETQKKVIASAQALGYVYNRAAANLRAKSTSTLGLILPGLDNSFYTELLKGVNQEANHFKKTILLGCTFGSLEEQERLISSMIEHRVCGIIIFMVPGTSSDTILRIEKMGIPVIAVNRNFPEYICDFIGIDDFMAGKLATEHLVSKGHKRIAFFGGISELRSWQMRKEGYVHVLKENHLTIDESLIMQCETTQEAGYEGAEKILQMTDKPTAVFCFNDVIAIGLMAKLEENGIKPGKDIAIIGADNIREAGIIKPKLTTIEGFPVTRGSMAVKLLIERTEEHREKPQATILEPVLVSRDSC